MDVNEGNTGPGPEMPIDVDDPNPEALFDPTDVEQDEDILDVNKDDSLSNTPPEPELESNSDDSDSDYGLLEENDDDLWELPAAQLGATVVNAPIPPHQPQHSSAGWQNIENHLHRPTTVEKFTEKYPDAGASIPIVTDEAQATSFDTYSTQIPNSDDNPYSPFLDHLN